ncbi:MAG: hypothetical protein N4A44_03230 [Alphaproteobacteria bacterium]|jgi:hypothetical protein|nr:hypothetical protein [Alphaproteobacteria bacterium]
MKTITVTEDNILFYKSIKGRMLSAYRENENCKISPLCILFMNGEIIFQEVYASGKELALFSKEFENRIFNSNEAIPIMEEDFEEKIYHPTLPIKEKRLFSKCLDAIRLNRSSSTPFQIFDIIEEEIKKE